MKKPLKEKLKQIGGEHLLNEAFSKKKVDTKIIAKRMMKNKTWFGPKWSQAILKKYKKGISEADLDRDMPEYVPGALISSLFDGLDEGKLRKAVRESIKKVMEGPAKYGHRWEIPMKDKKKVEAIVKKLKVPSNSYAIYGSGRTFEMEISAGKLANKVLELLMHLVQHTYQHI